MHMLVKLIFITAAYMYNIARASADPRNPPVATTDPRNPHVATTETQSPPQQFTSSTTERTARKHPTLYCTSSPTTGIKMCSNLGSDYRSLKGVI
ncbi:hypothetical protein cypCar_00042349 [Cyprinus carpio]|nr:hypothetical protein cypCar_00042349 [Cyprinus carpio]